MILDKYTEFTDGAAFASGLIGDVIDVFTPGATMRDIGNGRPVYWYVIITEAGAGGTSLKVQLTTSDDAGLAGADVVVETAAIPVADLTEGAMIAMIALPIEGVAYKKYVGIKGSLSGAFTGGKLASGLTLDPHGWKAYPSAEG